MRLLQIGILAVAAVAFIAAAFFIGTDTGLDLWRVGIAVLLLNMVIIKIWPTSPKVARAEGAQRN